MKIKVFLKREAINWFFILMPLVYILLVYDELPRFAPFLFNREQSIYYLILFVMGVAIFCYIILLIRPSLVPKTAFNSNLKSYHRIRTFMLGFTSLLSITFISQKIGIPFNWTKTGFILAMVFIMACGNIYPTIRYNYMIGIKNSWTQSNELIWKKTHSFAGKVFFWGGMIGAMYGILFNVYPVPYMPVIYVGYVFTLVFIPKVYSFYLYRQIHSHNPSS